MSRRTKRAVADLGSRLPNEPGALVAYCAAAQRSANRAGLAATGDLHGTLTYLIGRNPTPRDAEVDPTVADMVMYWLSRDALTLRRGLGLAT